MNLALLSTSDTDLLCARGSGAHYLLANPSRPGHTSMAEAIEAADIVVARILGGPQDLCDGYGYPQLTDQAKRKILGENLLRLQGMDPAETTARLGRPQQH